MPLGIKKPLDKIFNVGGIPMGGDGDTPLQAGTPENEIPNTHLVSASYRQVIDLSDFGKSMAVLPTGQSGHLSSAHYKDQTGLWMRGQLQPMLWRVKSRYWLIVTTGYCCVLPYKTKEIKHSR